MRTKTKTKNVTQAHSQGKPQTSPGAPVPAAGQPRPAGRKRRPGAHGQRPPHVPQRTCVACRQIEGKRKLIRIVRTPAGAVEVDATGKKNGRGAYLHADSACWESAFKRKALQHALKTEVSEADRAGLDAFRAGLAPVSEKDDDRHE